MSNIFEKQDRWGNSISLWIFASMVFLVPLSVWGVKSLQMENEVHNWIPKDNFIYQKYAWYRSLFPSEEPILVTWDRSSLDDPRVSRFVARLRGTEEEDGRRRGGSKYFERVRTPQELLLQIEKSKVSREEAIRRLQGVLIGADHLRVVLTDIGRSEKNKTIEQLRQFAQNRIGPNCQVTGPDDSLAELPFEPFVGDPMADSMVEPDPAGTETAEADAGPWLFEEPYDLRVYWPGQHFNEKQVAEFCAAVKELRIPAAGEGKEGELAIESCASFSGSPIALAVFLSEAGRADRTAAFQDWKAAAAAAGIPEPTLHMGGSPVAGWSLNQEVLKAVWNREAPIYLFHERSVIALSGLVGGIIAFWMLKSFRLAVLVLGASYFTTLVSTSLVPVTGGTMNMVLVVMPTLLLVTTISAAIHIANYWKHAAAHNLETSVTEAVKTAYVPCMWAGITSAIGQASLMSSSLTPVRDFGLYSAIGTLLSLAVVLYGLPALLKLWPGKAPTVAELDHHAWETFTGWVAKHHRSVTFASLALSLVCMWGLFRFQTETKVIRYFSDDTRTVKDYNFIEDHLAGIIPVDVIVRFDSGAQGQLKFLQRADLVRKIQTEMDRLPDVSGTMSLVTFLPQENDPGEQASFSERAGYAAKSRTIESRVKNGEQAGARTLLAMANRPTEFNARGDECWRITAQVAIMSKLNYADLTTQLDQICQTVLRDVSGVTAGGEAAEKVTADAKNRHYHPGASHVVTGMVPLFLATQDELLQSFIWSFMGAFGSIALIMVLQMKHPVAGLLAMVPNILPIGAVFGLISWSGLQVDIGSTVTASIALGITIDGTLHLITWFRIGIREGKTRAKAVIQAMGHCGPAMWQTSLVVSIGLLMLYPSDLILISRFGWLMAALLGVASAVDLILTPALLVGPLGQIIERCTVVESEAREPAEKAAPSGVQPSADGSIPRPHLDKSTMRIRRAE
jgi:uncharacterized protein